MTMRVPFMSLTPGPDAPAVHEAIDRVIERGWFILGPELDAFEPEFAAASGAAHAVGVGTGTDALALALRALGIGPGDEVITAPLSAAYSALAIVMAGATPVFADIDPIRLTMDPRAAAAAITPNTAALMPVHIYGQAADMTAFEALARRHKGLAIVEDACQAHFATCEGRPVGTFGAAGAFRSFYPTKNLGALGDGGAIITGDARLAERLRRQRNGGKTDRYRHLEFGVNSRPRRNAGRDPARALSPSCRDGRRAAARSPPAIAARSPARGRHRSPRGRRRPRLSPVSRPGAGSCDVHGPPRRRRHRHARALPDSRAATAGFCRPGAGRLPRRRPRVRGGLLAAAPSASQRRGSADGRGFGQIRMLRLILFAIAIAYIPGALIFRWPAWDRDRRAALGADERVFWHVVISLAWSLAVVLCWRVLTAIA